MFYLKYILFYVIIDFGDFMEKYLIALDLDGTLLNDASKISEKTKNYLINLKEKGHKIVLATGRPFRGTKPFYDELNLNTPLIFHNGAGINRGNNNSFKSFEKTIDKDVLNDLFLTFKDDITTAFYSVDNDLYVSHYLKEVEFFYFLNEKTKIYEGPLNHPNYPETSNILFLIDINIKEDFPAYIEKHLPSINHRFWFEDENVAVFEAFPKGYNKGTALNEVRDFYNIPKENTISFGDGNNDVELLKESGHGVKMVNGKDVLNNVKDAVTTSSNDNDGVIKYLQQIIK